MNTSKKINVNVSSLVGLKAELLRKHIEVKDAKAKYDTNKPTLINTKVKSRKVKVENKNESQKEKVTEIEDVNTLKKSKYMLIAKSRLYDKLRKNRGEGNENYLVDFKNKYSESSEDESPIEEDDYDDTNLDPDDDWVDYTDCFGRTRKCLRKDLPRMKEKDSLIEREIKKKLHSEEEEERVQLPSFIPLKKEPEIEIMRKKWEEQTEKLANKSDIHYQDVLFDEARTHGVGYYAFSHDEDERAKQQLDLAKLRKDTEQKQKEIQEIRALKSKMEENRLKTARIRARIRAGLSAELTEEEIENDPLKPEPSSTDESRLESKSPKKDGAVDDVEQSKSNDKDSLIVIEDKIKAFGELLGKRMPWREMSQEEWIHKRRKDRRGEFAPVYENFKSVGTLMTTKHDQVMANINDDDPLRICVGGPEPTDIWESSGQDYLRDDTNTEGIDNLEKTSTADQPTVSMNYVEPPASIQLLPPLPFNPYIPPPPVPSSIPPLSIPVANSNFVPPPSVIYPVPPPPFTDNFSSEKVYSNVTSFSSSQSQKISDNILHANVNANNCTESSCDSSSDGSDIIGPMPPSLPSAKDVILQDISLPKNSAPNRIQDFSTELSNTELTNQNIDRVTAGLKYLRQKFEASKKS